MPEHEAEAETPQISNKAWHINEHRPLSPFAQERHALDLTCFTPYADEEARSEQLTYYIADDLEDARFRPKFVLNVDTAKLSKTTSFDPDDLVVSLTARGHGTKNYHHIASWPLVNMPGDYECTEDDLRGLSPQNRITFCVIISLPSELHRAFGRPHYKASILADKNFTVQKEPESPSFPTKPVPPSHFIALGLPADSLWFAEFTGDPQAPTFECITIYINEIAVKKLNKAFSGNVAGGLLRNQLAAEIFLDISQQVIVAGGNQPAEEGSVLEQIRDSFQRFNLSDEKLYSMANHQEGSRLRCYVQSYLNIARKIESADLRRPWQR